MISMASTIVIYSTVQCIICFSLIVMIGQVYVIGDLYTTDLNMI